MPVDENNRPNWPFIQAIVVDAEKNWQNEQIEALSYRKTVCYKVAETFHSNNVASPVSIVNWHEILLTDLFRIEQSAWTDRANIQFEPDGKYEFIGRTSKKYGVQGMVKHLGYEPNSGNTFALVQVGISYASWREKPWYSSQNIFVLTPLTKESYHVHSLLWLQSISGWKNMTHFIVTRR